MSLPFHAAEEFLAQFRDKFISAMDAKAVAFDLLNKGTINGGVVNDITKESDPKYQNKILYEALKKCTDKHLMAACDMIIAVDGNPIMTAFGEAMKRALVASKCVCSVQCMHVYVCLRVCVWTWYRNWTITHSSTWCSAGHYAVVCVCVCRMIWAQ